MKITINTELLKMAVGKAAKGSGNNNITVLSSAIGVEARDTDLVFITTDMVNTVEVYLKEVFSSPISFYVCTDSDLFSKLISKQSSENVMLELKENFMQVTGSGVYNLPYIQDEEGNMAKFKVLPVDSLNEVKIKSADLKNLLKTNKLVVAKDFTTPIFTGYCVNKNNVYTFDGFKACISNVNFGDLEILLPQRIVELFDLFEDKEVSVKVNNNKAEFKSEDVTITGTLLEEYEAYPCSDLYNVVYSEDDTYSVKVSKNSLLKSLDRLSLFVSNKDQCAVQMHFSERGLILNNTESSACENVDYITTETNNNIAAYFVDLRELKLIVGAVSTEDVTIMYGENPSIKVEFNNGRFAIPTLMDEEVEVNDSEGTDEGDLTD